MIAVTSLGHATSPEARANPLPRLHELADVVIDNGGVVGDAAIEIDGFERRVGPTSTVVGAAMLNAIVAEVVEQLVARGITPDVYREQQHRGWRRDQRAPPWRVSRGCRLHGSMSRSKARWSCRASPSRPSSSRVSRRLQAACEGRLPP